MNNKQTPTDVLKILIPDDSIDHDPDYDNDPAAEADILDDARDQLADHLSGIADEAGPIDDPVMAALHHTLAKLRGIETERRLLLAYAREFATRRYSMEALASVAGMSASNIRHGKAYTDDDIAAVARRIGRGRPGPPTDPELSAINTQIEILDGSPSDRYRAEVLSSLTAEEVRRQHPDLDLTASLRVIDYLRKRYRHTITGSEN